MKAMQDQEASDDDVGFGAPAATTTTRRKGRGRATETVITKRELVEEDDKASPMTFAALFDPGPDDHNEELAVRVRVTRTDPSEGMLGYIEDMEATEQFILQTWGGSTYRLDGLNGKGKIVRVKTLKLAGDPIFVSEAADQQWRKARGLPPRGAQGQLSAQEILAMIEERESKRAAAEKEAAAERRREEREAQEQRRREEREFAAEQERQRREWEDRKRRDDEEREAKRRREDQEREDKRRRDQEESERRQREYAAQQQQQSQQLMTQMLTIVTQQAAQSIAFVKETVAHAPKGDASEMLIKGVQLALQLRDAGGGEGEEDLLQTVVKQLPGILNGIGNAATKVVREFKDNADGGAAPAAQTTPEGGLVLPPGKASEKVQQLITHIAERGGDPEQVLAHVADQLMAAPGAPNGKPKQVAARPNAPVMDPGPAKPETAAAAPAPAEPAVGAAPPKPKPSDSGKVKRLSFKK